MELILDDGTVLSPRAVEQRITDAMRWLAPSVDEGDRIALLSDNSAELISVILAATRLRLTTVLLNARLTSTELRKQLAIAQPRLCIADTTLKHLLEYPEVSAFGPLVQLACGASRPSEADFVLFTSGTTGTPKGAQLTRANLTAAAEANRRNLGPQKRWLLSLPLFHIGGLAMLWRCALDEGSLVVHPRFDAARTVRALETQAITHASLVPTTLRRLLDAPGMPRFPSLEALLIGGGPSDGALLARARDAGLPVLWTYGLTEASSQAATQSPASALPEPSAPAIPGVDVRIVDGSRNIRAVGEPGEIEIRGPTVMLGYLENAEATAEALPGDGWLRTRDLGVLDGRGHLSVLSRRTDLIVRGGENVYPAEIESVLCALASVEDAVVVPAPDEEYGQVPVAGVVLRTPVPLPVLEAHLRANLARFKVPVRLHVVDALPRNAMGKLDRQAARVLLGAFGTRS